mmetsp:Transcript_6550/g.22038  ORF Transcript_6550/g.22038 Transcript_6550/m.22038 type:complete len:134 (+) Transcript_6550:820-1221(+)
MTSSSSSSEGIVAVSSSDDDVVRSNDASSDAGTGNTDTAAILAQMPLALRAQLVAVAKASSNPAPAAVVDEWSKKDSTRRRRPQCRVRRHSARTVVFGNPKLKRWSARSGGASHRESQFRARVARRWLAVNVW